MATNESMFYNEEEVIAEDKPLELYPVLLLVVGTTMAEELMIMDLKLAVHKDAVPWRGVVIDSIRYGDLVKRLVQNGYREDQVKRVIPPSHFFHLESPFGKDFDFDAPLNREWREIMFDPQLQTVAKTPDTPGAKGTPAEGRARVEGGITALRSFLNRHVTDLTRVRLKAMTPRDGVYVFLLTTYRGGTGTGASMHIAALLKKYCLPLESKIMMHIHMPCIFGQDTRTYANAVATVSQNQWFHASGRGVPFKDGAVIEGPADAITYIFGENGRQSLKPVDALMLEAGILLAYLRAPTQQTFIARRADLTDVFPFDMGNLPMHCRIESAVSIRTIKPGVMRYMAVELIRQVTEDNRQRFEVWSRDGRLSHEEEQSIDGWVQDAVRDLNLTRPGLISRLDSTPPSTSNLRTLVEGFRNGLSAMEPKIIQRDIEKIPRGAAGAIAGYKKMWEKQREKLMRDLPREIMSYVRARWPGQPHIALAVLSRCVLHLQELISEADENSKREEKIRQHQNHANNAAINEVKSAPARGFIINRREMVINPAGKVIDHTLTASLSRVRQELNEYLKGALENDLASSDGRGRTAVLPAVIKALQDEIQNMMAAVRKAQNARIEELSIMQEDIGVQIEKQSQVFDRSVLYDQADRAALDAMVSKIHARNGIVPPLEEFLKGCLTLAQAIDALIAHLPACAESARSLTEILLNDRGKREIVMAILKNLKPFTPVDHVVEEQQNLRDRRDNLRILEIPGGQDGSLAQLFINEGVVDSVNNIVDSGDGEVRLFSLRDGIPYYALTSLTGLYKNLHDEYLKKPNSISPYSIRDAHRISEIRAPRYNLQFYTESLIWRTMAVFPERIGREATGEFFLVYKPKDRLEPQKELFIRIEEMVDWISKWVEYRLELEEGLKQRLIDDPESFKRALVRAWRGSEQDGRRRRHLEAFLIELEVNPEDYPKADRPDEAPEGRAASI